MAGARIPFARYMERCLYDEAIGYYASGRVRFGLDGHFSTYAERLSPIFGRMVARALREAIHALEASGRLPDGAPLTVLELGAGDGDLARDVLDELEARRDEPGWGFVERLTYVVGDESAALRARQQARTADHLAAGRLVVRRLDASNLVWDGPFYGVVLANELIDAFPCEHLIVTSRMGDGVEQSVRRVMVRGETASGAIDDEDTFWAIVAAGEPLRVRADAVPWTEAWPDGVPAGLEAYLEHMTRLIDDLATCALLPASLCWAPGTPRFVRGLADLLDGRERAGIALLVDYGGTSRHVIDPRARVPHLRAYAGEEPVGPLDRPGEVDLTWDVDFTDLARLARRCGLQVLHFGPQASLEGPGLDLDAPDHRLALSSALVAAGYTPDDAASEADELVASFRHSRGFQLIALGPPGVRFRAAAFDRSASVDALETLAREVTPDELNAALAPLGLEDPASWLLPGCDPRANCEDHDAPHRAEAIVAVLAHEGWLRGAGEV